MLGLFDVRSYSTLRRVLVRSFPHSVILSSVSSAFSYPTFGKIPRSDSLPSHCTLSHNTFSDESYKSIKASRTSQTIHSSPSSWTPRITRPSGLSRTSQMRTSQCQGHRNSMSIKIIIGRYLLLMEITESRPSRTLHCIISKTVTDGRRDGGEVRGNWKEGIKVRVEGTERKKNQGEVRKS